MTKDQIKKAITDAGLSYDKIADTLNPRPARQSVADVVNKVRTSARIMIATGTCLGVDPCEVFPEKADHIKSYLNSKSLGGSTSNSHEVRTSGAAGARGGRSKAAPNPSAPACPGMSSRTSTTSMEAA